MIGAQQDTDELRRRAAELLAGILGRDRRAIARAITEVENETAVGRKILRGIYAHLGRAWVIGVTGPPGAGKSTLVGGLIAEFVKRGHSVGVVAIDPSSPFSGGAVLGDRIRMERHSVADDVFIRSLAARGHQGGLCRAVFKVVDMLDAAGYEVIIVETVGAGQAEVEVADIADTRVVVCPPGLGDDVQALKAGILEIADVFVISKCDLPLADKTELDLRFLVSLRKDQKQTPRIARVTATQGQGVPELVAELEASAQGKRGQRRERLRERMRKLIAQEAGAAVRDRLITSESTKLDVICDALANGEMGHEEAVSAAVWLATANGATNVETGVGTEGNEPGQAA